MTKLRTIQRTISFKGASPKALYETYIDPKKHSALIGSKVVVSRKVGAPFSAFGGAVTGRNLMIVPDRLIVQTWRGNSWHKKDMDSILTLFFESTPEGAQIHMTHSGVPSQFVERWNQFYWVPLRRKLREKSV